jgi:hypothetical protein
MPKKCTFIDCTTTASFGYECDVAERCSRHKLPNMISKTFRKCMDCDRPATYGVGNMRTHCSLHCDPSMVNQMGIKCTVVGCDNRKLFGMPGSKPTHCREHRTSDMEYYYRHSCAFEGCKLSPSFNVEGSANGLYCMNHRKPGMVNVHKKKCSERGCSVRASHNHPSEYTPAYCIKHAYRGMVCLTIHRCKEKGCTRFSCYGIANATSTHCAMHKKENQIFNPLNLIKLM